MLRTPELPPVANIFHVNITVEGCSYFMVHQTAWYQIQTSPGKNSIIRIIAVARHVREDITLKKRII
jgi:hypothetical protein